MTTPAPEDNAKKPSEMSMGEIIADCRRKQQKHERRIPVQLEISEDEIQQLDMTIGDIEEQEMWDAHTRERIAHMMRRLAGEREIPWASEHEALEQWRSETEPEEWVTFPEDWIEP